MTSKQVKEIRESLGMNRKQFAKALGSTERTVQAWETMVEPGNFAARAIEYLREQRTQTAAK